MATVPGPSGLVQVLVAAAKKEFAVGRPVRAQAFLDLVRQAGTHPDVTWRRTGELLFEAGEFESAGRALGFAAAFNPADAGLQAQLARVCFCLGDLEAFEGYLGRALALNARHPAALELVAEVNRDHGDPLVAADVFIRLLRERPACTRYLRALDGCWNGLGAAATAVSLVEPRAFGGG